MSKKATERRLKPVEAMAKVRTLRTSPRKLNLVAQSIRGQTAEAALATLTFSPKRIARTVKKVLESAIANAENNHDLDVDSLVVSEASVGKNLIMKRFHARARGRGARIEKPFSQVTIIVEEREAAEKPEKSEKAAKKPEKTEKAAKKPEKTEKAAKKPQTSKKPARKPETATTEQA
jgi:large subunit ribosomal protein L22